MSNQQTSKILAELCTAYFDIPQYEAPGDSAPEMQFVLFIENLTNEELEDKLLCLIAMSRLAKSLKEKSNRYEGKTLPQIFAHLLSYYCINLDTFIGDATDDGFEDKMQTITILYNVAVNMFAAGYSIVYQNTDHSEYNLDHLDMLITLTNIPEEVDSVIRYTPDQTTAMISKQHDVLTKLAIRLYAYNKGIANNAQQ